MILSIAGVKYGGSDQWNDRETKQMNSVKGRLFLNELQKPVPHVNVPEIGEAIRGLLWGSVGACGPYRDALRVSFLVPWPKRSYAHPLALLRICHFAPGIHSTRAFVLVPLTTALLFSRI
jgi:hypothetical protein